MNRLVLIDGNAILHRAYHALPPLTAPDGSIVNAVYGFTSMVLKIFTDLAPSHMAVAFDRAAPTFRKKIFTEYQAQRPKMEDALVSQIEKVHGMVRAMGIPIYELDGYEADDVIGTIAKKALSSLNQIIIVTGDRDMLQLVEDEKVFLYMPTKGLSEAKLYGEKEVMERLEVKPSQVVELKALMGDASDNYPGVAGIGPKTAVELITKFGTVEKLYQAINNVNIQSSMLTPALVEKLKQGEESARTSHMLATIRRDAPIAFAPEDARVTTLNTPEARKTLEDFHFHTLLKRLVGKGEKPSFVPPGGTSAGEGKKKSTSEQQQLF
ncbi:hypothetical protein HY948_01305 [Candidatus Gottesmanbacteria bacterium]|nr:hypothetical protein [Candidatus Gottesmanbacteria bacterium]